MDARRLVVCMVVCMALLIPSGAQGDEDNELSITSELELDLQKGEDVAAAAQAAIETKDTPAQAVFSTPHLSVDVNINKEEVPLLTATDAPCKKVCKNKCTTELERHCLNVTIPKKRCSIEKKTVDKEFCQKKCKPTLTVPLPPFKVPLLPKTVDNKPNPSAPPAFIADEEPVAAPTEVTVAVQPSTTSTSNDNAADDGKAAKLQGIVDAFNPLKKLAQKVAEAKPDLDINCRDVCVTIPIVIPELNCETFTEQVTKCSLVPDMTCQEHCVCIPQKKLSLSLPKKPALTVSVSEDKKSV